jgi:hypothetical protein
MGASSASKVLDKTSGRSTSRSNVGSTARDSDCEGNAADQILSNFLVVDNAPGKTAASSRGSRSGIVESASAKKPQEKSSLHHEIPIKQMRSAENLEPQRVVQRGSVTMSTSEQHAVLRSEQEHKSSWSTVTSERFEISVAPTSAHGVASKKTGGMIDGMSSI